MYKKLLITALAAALLAGCKLKIVVPEGGHVVSENGNRITHAQGSVEIDVRDFEFEDTFFAIADPDWKFVEWKQGALCSGGQAPCELATAPLQGHALLEAFLASDREVVLEPVFMRAGTSIDPNSAMNCFYEGRYEPYASASFSLQYRRADDPDYNRRIDQTEQITGTDILAGNDVIVRSEYREIHDLAAGSVRTEDKTRYLSLNRFRGIVREHGVETRSSSGSNLTSTYEPPLSLRFDLMPGDSYRQSYTETRQGVLSGSPVGPSDLVYERNVQFLGIETVSTPAGEFQACHFQITRTHPESGGVVVTDNYHAVGTEIIVATGTPPEDGGALVSGTVNGVSLQGL